MPSFAATVMSPLSVRPLHGPNLPGDTTKEPHLRSRVRPSWPLETLRKRLQVGLMDNPMRPLSPSGELQLPLPPGIGPWGRPLAPVVWVK